MKTPLAKYLTDNDIRQGDFAEAVGRDAAVISKIVNGRAAPTFSTAARIEIVTAGAVPIHCWSQFSILSHLFHPGRAVPVPVLSLNMADTHINTSVVNNMQVTSS